MVPLVLIKMKILKVLDRSALLSRVVVKIMFMHTSLFLLRVGTTPFIDYVGQSIHDWLWDVGGLVGSMAVLFAAFGQHWFSLFSYLHRDVQAIHAAAVVYAVALNCMSGSLKWSDSIIDLQNAVE